MRTRARKPAAASVAHQDASSSGPIASRDNQWLKKFRAVLQQGEGLEEGLVGVEGPRLVEEAFRSGLEVATILVSPSAEKHLRRLSPWLDEPNRSDRLQLLRTSDRLFATISATESPQGIAALARARSYQFDDLLRGPAEQERRTPLVVVLVGVQDPGNVGTIFRSAEAFGASGVVAAPGTANPLGPKALRASAGSAFRVPAITRVALPVVLAQLRIARIKLFAACPESAHARAGTPQAAAQVDLSGPTALLIGNEGAGLPEEVLRSADAAIGIPLAAGVESLNAAVAASVLLYEAARQRA